MYYVVVFVVVFISGIWLFLLFREGGEGRGLRTDIRLVSGDVGIEFRWLVLSFYFFR